MRNKTFFVDRRCRNFLDSHQRRPENTPLFLLKLKSLKVLAVLTHLAVSILGQHLFQVWIWDNDETLPDAVSASSVVGYSFHKCLFEPILWTFFQDFVLQSRNLLIVIPASAYLFLLFDCLKAISGPLLRGQPDLTEINHKYPLNDGPSKTMSNASFFV